MNKLNSLTHLLHYIPLPPRTVFVSHHCKRTRARRLTHFEIDVDSSFDVLIKVAGAELHVDIIQAIDFIKPSMRYNVDQIRWYAFGRVKLNDGSPFTQNLLFGQFGKRANDFPCENLLFEQTH